METKMWRLKLLIVLALAAMGACVNADSDPNKPNDIEAAAELRSYTLPEKHTDQTFELLRDALEFGARDERGNVIEPVARVVRGPGRTAIVLGPERIHDGVESLVETVGSQEMPEPDVQKTIEVTYWLVRGLGAEEVEVPTPLEPASKALDAITKEHGPMRFQLVERTFVRSVAGSDGEAVGRYLKVKQDLDVRDDGAILGYLQFGHQTGELATKVALTDGQILVVGETGAGSDVFVELGLESASTPATLFYVVRARAL
jgi:hypothetical protein